MKNFVCATLGRRIVLTLRNVNSWVGRKTHAFTPAIPLEEAIKRGRSRRGGGEWSKVRESLLFLFT